MTVRFSGDFEREIKEMLLYHSVVGCPPLNVDLTCLCFEPSDWDGMPGNPTHQSVQAFCTKLGGLPVEGLSCSRYQRRLDELLSLAFNPPPLQSLRRVRYPGQPAKFHEWLVRSMNSSPVMLLIVEWMGGNVLMDLQLPHLIRLICTDHDFSLVPLVRFLNRHPKVQSINLQGRSYLGTDLLGLQRELRPLPGLTSISAGLLALEALFSLPDNFPVLSTVGVHGPLTERTFQQAGGSIDKIGFGRLALVLALISKVTTVTSIKLPFLSHFAGTSWLSIKFAVHPSPTTSWQAIPLTGSESPQNARTRPERLLFNITKLTLHAVQGYHLHRDVNFDIVKAVSLFPSVTTLCFRDHHYLRDMGWLGNEGVLLDRLSSACPRLHTVTFGLVKHQLARMDRGKPLSWIMDVDELEDTIQRLLSLPNELILAIASLLDIRDVASLGCVCRGLNHLVLGNFVNTTIPTLTHLRCHREPPSAGSQPFFILCLLLLCLFKTPEIHLITLGFSSDFGKELAVVSHFKESVQYRPSWSINFVGMDFTPTEGESLSQLYDSFRILCERISSWECRSLHLSADVDAFDNLLSSSAVPFTPPPLNSLYALSIPPQSDRMLDWIVDSMNNSPVQLLVIDGSFEVTLGRVTVPQLSYLTCLYSHEPWGMTVNIVKFLARHPGLVSMDIAAHSFRAQDIFLVPRELRPLPLLRSMAASLNVLQVILGVHTLLFPALQEICINGPIVDSDMGSTEERFILLSSVLILASTAPAVVSL
ncbi:hypothetical protein ARMSODRAFT_1018826 [Armillaria solidipes]|uniref:F-box domain-containing protein n=1 Tax=Armillaria solidipes TaxID=1076256 RepID=A0A2H3BTP8_9AGAR|nr:hypothetical protein ARMSODRAFT_1018826 [Armillaria solidipes]